MDLRITNATAMYASNATMATNKNNQTKINEIESVKLTNSNTTVLPQYSEELEEDAVVTYGASTYATTSVASTSSTTPTGLELQQQLANMGFYNGAYDGSTTSSSFVTALKNFERVFCGTSTGKLTTSLKSKIKEYNDAYTTCLNSKGMSTVASKLSLSSTHKKNAALTWVFLQKGMGLTKAQAAGVMGNIFAESAFSCVNAQDSSYPGEDNYSYSFKSNDSVGYGLLQWTYSTRKQGLQNMATTMGRPVSNLVVQLAHFRDEMINGEFKSAWNSMKKAGSYSEASDIFLSKIEKPKTFNYAVRRDYSLVFFSNLS